MALSIEELLQRLSEAANGLTAFPQPTQELIKRLQIVEDLVGQIEQSPSQTVKDSLLPTTAVLIADDLLKHADMDIKTSAVACIVEILRIFAPDAPFSDDQTRDVLQATILVFDQLSRGSGRTFDKAVTILDVVMKIKLAVLLLDLECDVLVLEMFNQFFRNIRSDHPESVLPCMESMMVLVVNESDTISFDLLSILLSSVRKENQETTPTAFKLGEKVLSGCASKLKLYIVKAVRKGRIDLDDYVETVNSLYQEGSNGPEHCSGANGFKENVEVNVAAGDAGLAKTKENTEQPETGELKPIVSNGAESSENNKGAYENLPANKPRGLLVLRSEQAVSEDNMEVKLKDKPDAVPYRLKEEGQLKREIDCSETESDPISRETSAKPKPLENSNGGTLVKSEPNAAMEPNISPLVKAKKADNDTKPSSSVVRGRSRSGSMKSPEQGRSTEPRSRVTGGALVIKADNNAGLNYVTRKRGHRRAPKPRSDGNVIKPVVAVNSEVDETASASLPEDPNPTDVNTHPRRCRQRSKASTPSQEADENVASAQAKKKTPKSVVFSAKKEPNVAQEGPSVHKRSARRGGVAAKRTKDIVPKEREVKLAEKSDAVDVVESSSGLGSGSRRKRSEPEKKSSSSAKRSKSSKGNGSSSKRKSASKSDDFGFGLVGRSIMVWWPLDTTFYDGVVDSYDAVTKMHLVIYTDGDQELLDLKTQRWKLLESDPLPTQGEMAEPVELADSSPIINLRKTTSNQKRQAKKENELGSQKVTRSARGKQAKKSNQVKEVKVTPSSSRSQPKRNQKAKAVEEKKVEPNSAVKQQRNGDPKMGKPDEANLLKEADSSCQRPAVESNSEFATKECVNEVIELSDSEDEEDGGPKNNKKPKLDSKKAGGPTKAKNK